MCIVPLSSYLIILPANYRLGRGNEELHQISNIDVVWHAVMFYRLLTFRMLGESNIFYVLAANVTSASRAALTAVRGAEGNKLNYQPVESQTKPIK